MAKKFMDRPEILYGCTTKIKTGYGTLYVTVNEYKDKPFEVFCTIGKSGKETTAVAEAIGRLTSLALQGKIPIEYIVDQLKGIGGENPEPHSKGAILSIPDAISYILEERYLKENVDGEGKGRAAD